jgi:SRSO17 transposase
LYLPEAWADDAERRTRTHVPAAIRFQTKPDLALGLIDQAQAWGVPVSTVVADAGYGGNLTFLAGLEARHLAYICRVSRTFGVRDPDAVRAAAAVVPAYAGLGQPPKPRPAPLLTAEAVLAALPADAWQTISWREVDGAPLCRAFAAYRVHGATGTPRHSTSHHRVQTGPEGWLLGERPLPGENGERKYYFASLPPDTPLARLAALAHSRWPIEQFYEDAKGECGLDDYQGRRWDGLHRHLALVRLAYSFLVHQRRPTSPGPTPAGPFPPAAPTVSAGDPPADARLALPGSRPLAHCRRPDPALPPPTELTK